MKLARLALSALVFSFGAASPVLSQAQSYVDVALGNVASYTLNDKGQVTGYTFADDGFRAFITGDNGSGLTLINLPVDPYDGYPPGSGGFGINNKGQVVGVMFSVDKHVFATGPQGQDARSDGALQYLSVDTAPLINDLGQIAGQQTNGRAVILDLATDQVKVFGESQDLSATPSALNAAGQMVGYFALGSGTDSHAFISNSDGSLKDLGTLGGASSAALAINKHGLVVGWSDTTNGGRHAFMTSSDGQSLIDISPSVDDSSAFGVNDAGQIVGDYWDAGSGRFRPFITGAMGQGFQDLRTVMTTTGSLDILSIQGINNAGQLLVEDTAGQSHLLTPGVPEPGTMALWLLGLVGLGAAVRRRPS